MKTSGDDDDEGLRPHYRTNYGDIGVVVIAALCTLAFVLMMVLPSPVAKYQKDKAQQEERDRQDAIQKAVSSGEVSVGIAPAKH
jgi:ABC-type Fe3+ transport system permease subunit